MITKLTPEQESKIPVYLDKWMKNGLKTERISFETAKTEAKWIYSQFLKDTPEPIVFLVDSPMAALEKWRTGK